MTALFVGVGNRFRRDDAAGLLVADRLRTEALPGVRIVEREGDLASLIDDWCVADTVVLIDATSTGGAAGTVRRFDALEGPLPATFSRGSTHVFGVSEAIELARVLGRLPKRLIIYGIEGRDFSAGEGVGPEVRASVPDVVRRVLAEVVTHA